MTGRNRALNAARTGEKQRQLLKKEKLAGGNPFSRLTARANGRPLSFPASRISEVRLTWHSANCLFPVQNRARRAASPASSNCHIPQPYFWLLIHEIRS
jgi:hypothetical protein